MVLEQPAFEGSFPVCELDSMFFQEEIEATRHKKSRLLVYCYAAKHPTCKTVASLITDLAEK